MSAGNGSATKPLLLMDVDGVINDLEAVMRVRPLGDDAHDRAAQLGVDLIRSHGFWLAIPHAMPELIQDLTARSETWWCTTWGVSANDDIAGHLGVGPFPVVGDCRRIHGAEWRADAARPLIEAATAANRRVVWIGAFNGELPSVDNVTFIDTGEHSVLRRSDIPSEVLSPVAIAG